VEDINLINECLAENRIAQKRLYKMYAAKMLGVCYRYFRSKAEAEDALQEGFIKVFTHLKNYKGEGSLEGWIRRIMVNTSLNQLKARHRFTESIVENELEDHIDWSVDNDAEISEIMEEIRQLSTGFRTIFNLYAIEGYSHREIGEMLGISEGTSRSQYSRARSVLMKRLSGKSITGNRT
jgi:RNA polymerase sigma factor (sigma-70 family)